MGERKKKMAIGIFDSGIGGLTVFKEIKKLLPRKRIIYLGDTARVPYGTRSPEIVRRYSLENAYFLKNRGINFLVVACNTSSAVALDALRAKFDLPIVGVIEPGAKAAVKATKNKRVAVVGTPATIASGAYPKAIEKLDKSIKVIGQPCPLFVPIVEEGWLNHEATKLIAREYLMQIWQADKLVDTIVLGCTHYPLLKPLLKKVAKEIFDHEITFVDSAIETASALKELTDNSKVPLANDDGSVSFCITDFPERFKQVGGLFLKEEIKEVEVVTLPALEDSK